MHVLLPQAMYSDDLGAHSSDDSGVDDSDVGGAQGWCSDIDSIEQGHGDVGDGAVMHEEEQQEQEEQQDAERAGASAPRGGNAQRTHHKRLEKTGPATALVGGGPNSKHCTAARLRLPGQLPACQQDFA